MQLRPERFSLMPNSYPPCAASRFAILVLLAASLLPLTGCNKLLGRVVHHSIAVPPLLTPLCEAGTPALVAEVNRLAAVRSIRGKIDLQFQETSFAESGIAEQYRTAEGTVTLQRPGEVYLTINAPFGIDVAQMTSDGRQFRVAVLRGDEKYRRFVRGTNNAVYQKLDVDGAGAAPKKKNSADTEARAVSALSNLRPQHFTDALLIRPIEMKPGSGFVYARSEFFQEEPDRRPRAKAGARIIRGYYLLDEIAPLADGNARLERRFWFDRVGAIRFARLQTFDTNGALLTDVSYSETKPFGESGQVQMPSHIELTRPQDHYKLDLIYQSPGEVVLDREYPPNVFVLENRWQLPEMDLDKQKK